MLRAGLVLAAGAAGLAVTAGSASADSGLSGTLDHVSSTVKKVTGSGSSHSSSSSSSSTSSHSSRSSSSSHSTSSSSSHRSSSVKVSTQRVSVRKTVVRPVVRSVNRVAKPVVRVVHVESAHEKRVAKQAAEKKAEKKALKKRVQQVDRAVSNVSKTVLHAPAQHAKPGQRAQSALVTVDVAKTVASTTKAVSDVTSVVLTPRPSLDLPLDLSPVTLPELEVAVNVPAVDLGVVKLPSVGAAVGLPPVRAALDLPGIAVGVDVGVDVPGVDVPGLPVSSPALATPASSSSSLSVAPLGRSLSLHTAPKSLLTPAALAVVPTSPTRSGAVAADEADGLGAVVPHLSSAVSLLTAYGTSGAGADLGVAPDGAAHAGPSGVALFALVTAVGLAGLSGARIGPAHDRAGHASRLLRQPGFSPD